MGKIIAQTPKSNPKGNYSTYFWCLGRFYRVGCLNPRSFLSRNFMVRMKLTMFFGVQGIGFGVQGLGLGFRGQGLGFNLFEFRVEG